MILVLLAILCFFLLDGRHFKPVYGKDLVDTLITTSDQLMAELEKSAPERLSSHQNAAVAIQGQIDLIRSHQANQDRRISYALAREAEEADGRSNERCFSVFCLSRGIDFTNLWVYFTVLFILVYVFGRFLLS